ncbi:MAG TPA: DUF4349 domain-containing protein [Acidimicrobiales bacterium]|nr:DUF4349 domain-containing protein [Acidimicrobiales bacterium]
MTSTIDEELVRRALHDAMHDVEPSEGAQTRILEAALARHADDGDEGGDEDDTDAVEEIDPSPARRSRRRLVPLTAAAAALLITAVVLSVTTFGSPGPRTPFGSANSLAPSVPSTTIVSGAAALPTFSTSLGALSTTRQNATYGALQNTSAVTEGGKTVNSSSPGGGTATGALAPKVVAVGSIAMKVPSTHLQTVLGQLTVLVVRAGGYVASSKVVAGSSGESSTATIVLRVPEHRFDSLVSAVQRYGTPTSVVTNSSDVTGQYVDYQSRIAALKASRAQYLAILAKAGSISSILAVQSQIDNLQTQIDELEGQRNVLVNEAAYSMLTVNLNPGQGPTSASPSGLSTAWHDSIGGFVTGFESLVRGAGPALFGLLCLAVLFVLGRFSWRAARRRML